MDVFEQARLKYKPDLVKVALVAESPPKLGSDRFFYREDIKRGDTLFLETMKALYPEVRGNVRDLRARKGEFLRRFQADGFYLLDASEEPIPDTRRSTKRRYVKAGLGRLGQNLRSIQHPALKVILISSTVFDICREPLREAGFNVINTEMIDFPGSSKQKAFQAKFRPLLSRL